MIIFSDLDRSIIYSNKFIDEGYDIGNDYECIEKIGDKEISYISLKTLDYIKEIQAMGVFIPTTTRTTEQLRRINFSKYGITFKYSITCNGGEILKDNEIVTEWHDNINNIINSNIKRDILMKEFEKFDDTKGILSIKEAGELFFYLTVDKSIFNIEDIRNYILILNKNNWVHYISGRKIYFLPNGITKENAVNYIVSKENIKNYIAIGDSKMDLEMLRLAPTSYTLKHGELANYINENYITSNELGMRGTEEILSDILEKSYIGSV